MFRRHALCVTLYAAVGLASAPAADKPAELRQTQQTALAEVEARSQEILEVNRRIWEFAELGLEEDRSSKLLVDKLQEAGFSVQSGLSGMPTAFRASFGKGRPVIGILAEYDALPGMSQQVRPLREPRTPGAPGHACGHSGLAAGAFGAAMAVKHAMAQHGIQGTLRLYGTPAEETVIGKVYLLLDRQFDDLDICLHWHPSSRNGAMAGPSKALVSVKFTFRGTAAHASGSPHSGRSALDAVELMNVGVNFMREHIQEDARLHYVITNGGGAPNVVPAIASVWYFIRADDHKDVEANFQWVREIAQGAAMMTRTKLDVHVESDCHDLITNVPLAELLERHLKGIGSPKFTAAEQAFARRLQQPLSEEFGTPFPLAIDESIRDYREAMTDRRRGSTDVGDISWYVPTGGIGTTCLIAESPGHSWQNVAAIASTIGQKGILYASKVLAVSAIDLFDQPELITAAKADWKQRMKGRTYSTLIPQGQKPPPKIRRWESRAGILELGSAAWGLTESVAADPLSMPSYEERPPTDGDSRLKTEA